MIEIVEYISKNYKGRVVEVGVGHFFSISDSLEKKGFEVVRVDVRKTREDVAVDDVCNPDLDIYSGASLVLSLRPPIEIQKCVIEIGRKIGCDVIIIPLKNEIIDGGRLKNYKGVPFYIFTPQYRTDSQEPRQTP